MMRSGDGIDESLLVIGDFVPWVEVGEERIGRKFIGLDPTYLNGIGLPAQPPGWPHTCLKATKPY